MELQKIKSFQVDHTRLERGMYISRVDGDIITYDLRMKKPNSESVLENAALHTIEHIFATYVRSGDDSEKIIYFGPMGCRTGFYFITRGLTHARAISLTKEAFEFISGFTGQIPGTDLKECGNYLEHDLAGAKNEAIKYLWVLDRVCENSLDYN